MTRAELLEALLVERFQPTIPSDHRTEITPTLHELAERRRALIEASEATIEKRTA